MTLPTEPDVGKPDFLSDDWKWVESSGAWERIIGDVRLLYSLGYICSFGTEEYDYEDDFHSFIYDSMREAYQVDNYDQLELDAYFGLDTMGQIEGGYSGDDYSLAEDLAGIRMDVTGNFECACGNDEFYVIATPLDTGHDNREYTRTYGCTAANCSNTYGNDAIPSGVSVKVTNIHYME